MFIGHVLFAITIKHFINPSPTQCITLTVIWLILLLIIMKKTNGMK